MKEETTATNSKALVDDPLPNGRIKSAHLSADPESRLDSQLAKPHPISDSDVPYRD